MYMLLCSIISSISWALTLPDVTEPVQSTFYNKSDAIIVIGNEAYYSLPQSIFSERDALLFKKYGKHTEKIRKNPGKFLILPYKAL